MINLLDYAGDQGDGDLYLTTQQASQYLTLADVRAGRPVTIKKDQYLVLGQRNNCIFFKLINWGGHND